MKNYAEVLEKVAQQETVQLAFILILIIAIISLIWVAHILYYRKMKKRRPKKYHSQKETKHRCRGYWAAAALTVILLGLGVLICWIEVKTTVKAIHRDIEENAYVTYEGGYVIWDTRHSRHTLYDKWLKVEFDNGDYAHLHMDSLFEWLATEEGRFEGKVVYGKNSLVVVDIEGNK